MNPNEKPESIRKPVWPEPRAALLRLLLITLVVFPLSWAVNALLVGSWNLLGDRNAESVRHLVQWQFAWVATVCVVFLASLLPAFHRRFSPRIMRRLFFGLACVATLAALFYAEENWRGARAWNKYRRQLEAQGVQLDLSAIIPKPIPDEQNFAATPFIKSWFEKRTSADNDQRWNDSFSRAEAQVDSPTSPTISTKTRDGNRHLTDLVAWVMAFHAVGSGNFDRQQRFNSGKLDPESRAQAAPAVLEALKSNEAVFAELYTASRRPHSRYPIQYDLENPWGILLPHLANIRAVVQRLQLKANAELAAGRSDRALEDVRLMLYMTDSIKEEPFLITYLLRLACFHHATQPVWEGLAGHRWSEAQLQELQTRFQQFDFLADMQRPLNGERAAGILTADLVRKKGLGLLIQLIGPGQPTSMDMKFANWCGGFIPRGWYRLEQVNYCRLYELQIEGVFDLANKTVSPARIEANTRELEREIASSRSGKTVGGFLNHRIIASLLLPALHKLPRRAAIAQTAADQVALACALERHRLANGQFPETLDALTPRFISKIPNDVITGEPYKYRRTEDGQFVLYSVGWDEKDDGGEPAKKVDDEKGGDWVWQYPAK